jgi:hypothetical protein
MVGDILATGATAEADTDGTAGAVVLGAGAGGALASAEVLGAGGAPPPAGALGAGALAEQVQDGVGALGRCEGLDEIPALAAWAVTLADAAAPQS